MAVVANATEFIMGGNDVQDRAEYPYVVSLQYKSELSYRSTCPFTHTFDQIHMLTFVAGQYWTRIGWWVPLTAIKKIQSASPREVWTSATPLSVLIVYLSSSTPATRVAPIVSITTMRSFWHGPISILATLLSSQFPCQARQWSSCRRAHLCGKAAGDCSSGTKLATQLTCPTRWSTTS